MLTIIGLVNGSVKLFFIKTVKKVLDNFEIYLYNVPYGMPGLQHMVGVTIYYKRMPDLSSKHFKTF